LRHNVWHLEPREIVIANDATIITGEALRPTTILLPGDQRHVVVSNLVLLELGKIERISSPNNWIFRVPVPTVRCNRFGSNRNHDIFVLPTTGATRVSTLVTSCFDAGKGNINAWRDEGITVNDGSIGSISRLRCWDDRSVLHADSSSCGDWPVKDGCCPWEIMTIIAYIRI
jgi:hypothetical protein